MKNHKIFNTLAVLSALLLCFALSFTALADEAEAPAEEAAEAEAAAEAAEEAAEDTADGTASGVFNITDVFTSRDLAQEADLKKAVEYTVADGENIEITEDGVYVISGSASDVTISISASELSKVQLVLDSLTITNSSAPVIYAYSADKVFVTTASDSSLTVSGEFAYDADEKADAVIYSRTDLVMNGTGTLSISSSDNAVVSKDDLKVTGGTYNIEASDTGLEANDAVVIAGGTINIVAGDDGIHAENKNDDTLGYVCIADGEVNIQAKDDGIHAISVIQVDGGTLNVTAMECIEATFIQINGGAVNAKGSDKGINASDKSSSYKSALEVNEGEVIVDMNPGKTKGVNSKGDIILNGGTLNVSSTNAFDYDGEAVINGGTLIMNGTTQSKFPIS